MDFTDELKNNNSFEEYSDLDYLNRAGVAIANISKDLMPTEKRVGIGMIKPSGFKTVKYDFINGKYLYNRCHLIGYQLTGENANNSSFKPSFKNHSNDFFCTSIKSGKSSKRVFGIPIGVTLFAYSVDINSPHLFYSDVR